ncbi:hypothetical protein GCM10009642_13100 [Nocardiopsis metallicus]
MAGQAQGQAQADRARSDDRDGDGVGLSAVSCHTRNARHVFLKREYSGGPAPELRETESEHDVSVVGKNRDDSWDQSDRVLQ